MRLSQDLQIALTVALNEAAHRRHEYASAEHLLYALLLDRSTARAVRACGGNVTRLKRRLDRFLDEKIPALPSGHRVRPSPSLTFQRVLQRAMAHCEGAGKQEVNGPEVLVALYEERDCWAVHFLEEEGVARLDLVSYLSHGTAPGDADDGPRPLPPADRDDDGDDDDDDDDDDEERPIFERRGKRRRRKSPLDQFCTNLIELAAKGAIDPLIGRDVEVQRMLHVLCRRRKNNPVLVGDSGVGKTAIVEGLARKIHEGDVPDAMADAVVYSLDLGSLLAGTRYRGDFEKRVKEVLRELSEQDNAILFIDEIHTLIGAGSASGSVMDASNLLKPVLAQGKLRFIGSTTYDEYRNHFEKDRALARRFQKIEVLEPSVEETVRILEGLAPRYEAFHQVRYSKAAIRAAAELSARYLQDRRLPDKAIDLIDEAGASARLHGQVGRRVDVRDIERIVATMAQIPSQRVSRNDRDRLAQLEEDLRSVVFGQDEAISQVAAAIRMARAGLRDPDRPIGSFLFTGPTGVGKTEVARQLARTLGIAFVRFDMSEYMERHTVSRLIGAPPGYVGFDQGGLLTEAIHKTPHAVLLLDEIEKAHQDVFNILLQVMDHGTLTDTNGRKTDFRHVILIMTSNVGARELERRPLGFGEQSIEGNDDREYERVFSPEFRNRLDARIRFRPLDASVMQRIVDKFIVELDAQVRQRKVRVELTEAARALLAERGFDPKFGARPLRRVIQTAIKRPLSDAILFGELQGGGVARFDAEGGEIVLRAVARRRASAAPA